MILMCASLSFIRHILAGSMSHLSSLASAFARAYDADLYKDTLPKRSTCANFNLLSLFYLKEALYIINQYRNMMYMFLFISFPMFKVPV